MEEIVFKALSEETKFKNIESFIQEVLSNSDDEINYETVKEAVLKLILYRFITVDYTSPYNCIVREANFYQAQEIGGVHSWLAQKRAYNHIA